MRLFTKAFYVGLWVDAKLWWRGMSKAASKKSADTHKRHMDTVVQSKPGVTLLVAILCLTFVGCGSIEKTYVDADRATYEAIAEDWVELQPSDMRKKVAKAVIESWLARIEAAEKDID